MTDLVHVAAEGRSAVPGPTRTAAYVVADGTQVNVGGVVHEGGSTVDVDPATAALWLRAGYLLKPLPDKMPAKRPKAPASS